MLCERMNESTAPTVRWVRSGSLIAPSSGSSSGASMTMLKRTTRITACAELRWAFAMSASAAR